MEAVSPHPEQPMADKVSQRHHRPIVIIDCTRANERRDIGGENLFQIMEAPDVRILQHLVMVIIDKTIQKSVEIRKGGTGHNGRDKEYAGAVQPKCYPPRDGRRHWRSFPEPSLQAGLRLAIRLAGPPPTRAPQGKTPRRSFSHAFSLRRHHVDNIQRQQGSMDPRFWGLRLVHGPKKRPTARFEVAAPHAPLARQGHFVTKPVRQAIFRPDEQGAGVTFCAPERVSAALNV